MQCTFLVRNYEGTETIPIFSRLVIFLGDRMDKTQLLKEKITDAELVLIGIGEEFNENFTRINQYPHLMKGLEEIDSNESIAWAVPFLEKAYLEHEKESDTVQAYRNLYELVKDKNLLFVDDSIVRGTQLKETVDFLYENGAKEVHMRSACPPIMYGCKYLNFSRATSDMELIARRTILELEGEEGFNHLEEYSDSNTERGQNLRNSICKKFNFASLEFQSLEGLIKSIGIEPCKLCTYCWNGKE